MTYLSDYRGTGTTDLSRDDLPECPNCGTVTHWRASCGLWGAITPEQEREWREDIRDHGGEG